MFEATRPPRGIPGDGLGRLIDFLREHQSGLSPQINLPLQLTSFAGREREVADLGELLMGKARLLTLTGPVGAARPDSG